jgi:small subunit ribosomal protein S1
MADDNIHSGESSSVNSPDQNQMTMAELLDQEESFFRVLQPGDIVKGTVASKRSNEILVDVGAKSEGIVNAKDLDNLSSEEVAEIKIGDEIPVYVVNVEGEEDHINLSISQARIERDWDRAKHLFDEGETVESTVVGNNKGGLIVNFGQIRGFVPGSQLANNQYGAQRPGRWNQLTGEELRLKIIEVDRDRNRLIFSERAVAEEDKQEKSKFLEDLQEGEVRKGRVTSLANFGAFVDIGGIDGLIHLSELAWTRISHPNEIVQVGDDIEVHILNVDLEQNRVALSLKRLQPEPWTEVFKHYQINQVAEAVITNITDFGAFARLDNRIEGLIHISELADRNINHPREVVTEGEKVTVRIIHIDPDRQRMGLSLKQVDDGEGEENWADYQQPDSPDNEDQSAEADEA